MLNNVKSYQLLSINANIMSEIESKKSDVGLKNSVSDKF